VRFIGNHSSGKMGFDIAECAAKNGAEVVLVSGQTHLKSKDKKIHTIAVTSAKEMYDACHQHFDSVDVAIAAAAVADAAQKLWHCRKLKSQNQN
jgi:phosphopantothenoylcysteine decarboxylase/phosphopantothenate--cysteine ligase